MVQVPARVKKTLALMLVPHIHGHALATVEILFSLSLTLVGLGYTMNNTDELTGNNLLAFVLILFGAGCTMRCLLYFADELSEYLNRDR